MSFNPMQEELSDERLSFQEYLGMEDLGSFEDQRTEPFDEMHIKEICSRFGITPGSTREYVEDIYTCLSYEDMKYLIDLRGIIREAYEKQLNAQKPAERQSFAKEVFYRGMEYFLFLVKRNVQFITFIASEIGIESEMKTYSGGLGVLNGDIHEVATKTEVPFINFVLLPTCGYGKQLIDGKQSKIVPDEWNPESYTGLFALTDDLMRELGLPELHITVPIRKRKGDQETRVQVYVKFHVGPSGHVNPIFLVSTNVSGNEEWQRGITESLYPGTKWKKLCTQYVLAESTIQLVEKLDIRSVRFNMNEGHASLASMVYIKNLLEDRGVDLEEDEEISNSILISAMQETRNMFFFTTHTIVAGAFDIYSRYGNLDGQEHISAEDILEPALVKVLDIISGWDAHGNLNMAVLAADFARAINSVSNVHYDVTIQKIFPEHRFKTENITNGVYIDKWWPKELFDVLNKPEYKQVIGDFDRDYMQFTNVLHLKHDARFREDIRRVHKEVKQRALAQLVRWTEENIAVVHEEYKELYRGMVNELRTTSIDDLFIANITRRVTGYKQNDALVMVKDRLIEAARKLPEGKRLLFTYAGKAHSKDSEGQYMLNNILDMQRQMFEQSQGRIMVLFIQDYDMEKGYFMNHSDVSISVPVVGWEASGTSPGKNPLKLIVHTRDGFFPEVLDIADILDIEVGFPFGPDYISDVYNAHGVKQMYADALFYTMFEDEDSIMNIFFHEPERWLDMQIGSIAVLGMFFNMARLFDNYIRYWYPENNYLIFSDLV